MIDYEGLLRLTNDYNSRLNRFVSAHELPYTWFEKGQDHVAVKAFKPDDYKALVARFEPFSARIVETEMQGRWIATASLMGKFAIMSSLTVSGGIEIENVEIMLARPEDQDNGPPRFDHSEIYAPEKMIPVRSVLRRKGLHPDWQGNDAHEWVSVVFGEYSEEVKFTEKRLSEIVDQELASGKAKVIYEADI